MKISIHFVNICSVIFYSSDILNGNYCENKIGIKIAH